MPSTNVIIKPPLLFRQMLIYNFHYKPFGNKNAADLNSVMQQTEVNSKGSGLGLQIVKDLATRLGFKIFISNGMSIVLQQY